MKSIAYTTRSCLLAATVASAIALSACNASAPDSVPAQQANATQAGSAAYSIRGTLPDLPDGTELKLLVPSLATDPLHVEPVASATAQGGAFVLSGQVQQAVPAVLMVGNLGSVKLVLEPGELRIEQGPLGPVAKGGSLTERVYGYLEDPAYVAAFKANREANRKAFEGVDETDEAAMKVARESVAAPFAALSKVRNDYDAPLIDGNGPALLKLLVLSENYDWKRYDMARRAQLLASYKQELGEHPLITQMEQAAADYAKTQQLAEKFGPGKPYADIEAVGVDGKVVKLSEVLARNKLVLLDFWASWCGPCRGEFPHLLKVYREFHAHGFEIYAVSLDEDKADWTKAMQEEGGSNDLPWINLQAPGFEDKAAQTYGVVQLPQNYLIAGDGTIVGVGMREWDVERAVRAQIKKVEDAPAR